jgi:hypothetical protein
MASAEPRPDFPARQGRQDSNLQPPVLETGALPIELRPSVRGGDCTAPSTILPVRGGLQRRALGVLFLVIALAMAGIAVASALAGRWVIVFAAGVLAAWLATLAVRGLSLR